MSEGGGLCVELRGLRPKRCELCSRLGGFWHELMGLRTMSEHLRFIRRKCTLSTGNCALFDGNAFKAQRIM